MYKRQLLTQAAGKGIRGVHSAARGINLDARRDLLEAKALLEKGATKWPDLLPLREALNEMAARLAILDVRFFVTAVLIQRDTGGNLSEILENLAHVVRERFKIRRQVRVHTAHGRFTGYVLLALPAALAIALSFINPEHMQTLFNERMGQTMLIGAIIMQTVGFVWIRQVIKIEV